MRRPQKAARSLRVPHPDDVAVWLVLHKIVPTAAMVRDLTNSFEFACEREADPQPLWHAPAKSLSIEKNLHKLKADLGPWVADEDLAALDRMLALVRLESGIQARRKRTSTKKKVGRPKDWPRYSLFDDLRAFWHEYFDAEPTYWDRKKLGPAARFVRDGLELCGFRDSDKTICDWHNPSMIVRET